MKTLTEFKHVVSKKEFYKILDKFIPFCKKELNINEIPKIKFISSNTAREKGTFGSYKKGIIKIDIHQRHPIDVLRTLAHEFSHFKQHLNKEKDPHRGETGSKSENEAHVMAGIIMRNFDHAYPEFFKLSHIE
jgi:Zn-dependent peptidase ImmA (M78 family)